MKWVPISFCQFVIEINAFGAAKLFIYLKYHSDGFATEHHLNMAKRYFEISDRTLYRWKKEAETLRFLEPYNGNIYVAGWQYLINCYMFHKKACFKFKKSDLKKFKTFCYAAVIIYMARAQVMELERHSRYTSNEVTKRSNKAPTWVPLAAKAIAKTLRVPESTARKYRNEAAKKNYFKKKHNLQLKKGISVNDLMNFRVQSPEVSNNLIIKHGKVFEQLPDLIQYNDKLIHTPRRFKTKYSPHISA